MRQKEMEAVVRPDKVTALRRRYSIKGAKIADKGEGCSLLLRGRTYEILPIVSGGYLLRRVMVIRETKEHPGEVQIEDLALGQMDEILEALDVIIAEIPEIERSET
jgi:hypothetical protein